MTNEREFNNPYEDIVADASFLGNRFITKVNDIWELDGDFVGSIQSNICKRMTDIADHMRSTRSHDTSVYTGWAGLGVLAAVFHTRIGHFNSRMMCEEIFDHLAGESARGDSLQGIRSNRVVSLLCGRSGVWAVTAVLAQCLNQQRTERHPGAERVVRIIQRLCDALELVKNREDAQLPDELLYGRAGYLAALLYLRQNGVDVPRLSELIRETVDMIVWSGQRQCCQMHRVHPDLAAARPCPLMYTWHEKHYLGAAHGISGIVTLLLQVPDVVGDVRLNQLVRPTVDYLATLVLQSGNFPSSLENVGGDRLVHWCHGAPAFAHMFCLAFRVFGDPAYRRLAVTCSDLTWRRGLLRKGHGLCHGTAGNAYVFLHVFQITQDAKHLHRACCFADWCMNSREQTRTPDRPFSLFEGLAGTVYFLIDLMHPGGAKFPAFIF